MNLPRYYDNLEKFLKPGKVIVIAGPRQVGKTTLLTNFLEKTSFKYRLESGRIKENIYKYPFYEGIV